MGRLKEFAIQVEQELQHCLNKRDLTTQQSLNHIQDVYGTMGLDFAKQVLVKWHKEGLEEVTKCKENLGLKTPSQEI